MTFRKEIYQIPFRNENPDYYLPRTKKMIRYDIATAKRQWMLNKLFSSFLELQVYMRAYLRLIYKIVTAISKTNTDKIMAITLFVLALTELIKSI